MNNANTPYELLGEEGIRALASAFYDALEAMPEVADIRCMHAQDLGPMKEKLAEYLIGWMGGPPIYAQKYGSVCMTTPHKPFAIGPRERDQWLLCMEKALDTINASEELRAMLKEPVYRIADAVRNREISSSTQNDPNIIASSPG